MIRRPPRSTRTDTLFPYTTLFRSDAAPTAPVPLIDFARTDTYDSPSLSPDGKYLALRFFNGQDRSEEHTSELQSLMRISYAVLCLKKQKTKKKTEPKTYQTLSRYLLAQPQHTSKTDTYAHNS